ncbi:MAG: NUDIX hydrolase, partial [Thaumarchaeota archaeon]|nr:NUDIX hydrolase [Nitrososphaerota archaeon]
MNKRKIYEGKILSLSLYSLPIRRKRVIREVVEHRGAAAVLAITDGKIILVKQYRFPYGYVHEIPAGTLEKGESPKSCAFRELKEETGYEAMKMTPLIKYYPSIGYNTEVIHCYVA